jgi:hypothetical protein
MHADMSGPVSVSEHPFEVYVEGAGASISRAQR